MSQPTSLKKGDLLIKEGDTSNSMYWLQSGALRLFKKKGNGFIELGMAYSGEVVGEMSFFDNQPRSASAEALQTCEIIEIPRGKFDEFFALQPSWLKALVNTLVKRLRTTSNRLRELESASVVYAKDEIGRTTKIHEFLSNAELLKLCSTLILVGSRYAEKQADSTLKVRGSLFQLFGGNIAGIQVAKVQVFLATLQEAGYIHADKKGDGVDLYIRDLSSIERFLFWLQDDNSKAEDKQIQISDKAMVILEALQEFGGIGNAAPDAETFTVDMEQVFMKLASINDTKIPFDWNAFPELVAAGLSKELRTTGPEKLAVIQMQKYLKLYPLLSLRQRFRDINSKKRGED